MDPSTLKEWIAANAALLSGLDGLLALIGIGMSLLFLPLRHKLVSRRAARADFTQAEAIVPLAVAPDPPAPATPLRATLPGPGAVAVMPFDSLSGDPEDAHLADGLSCEIISALARAGYQHIAPRADSFALRGSGLSLAEIARRLSVRYVVHGSVRHDGDTLRVIAEFADSSSCRLLWSKTYERPFADILQVQEEIAQVIASSLGGEAFRAEILNLAHSTDDSTAWSLVQKARHDYMISTAPKSIEQAVDLVRKALQRDPNYAVAHALLAQLLMDLVSTASARDHERMQAEARAAIEQALALGSRDPDVLMYAGRVWLELGEHEQSVSVLRRGTQLWPCNFMEWGFLARSLAFGSQANAREALEITPRILEIAPEHPCVWTWNLFDGIASMNLERYPEALVSLQKAVEASPKFVRALMCLASAQGACDQPEEAARTVARSLAINPSFTPQRFAGYAETLSDGTETAARLTAGLRKARLLDG